MNKKLRILELPNFRQGVLKRRAEALPNDADQESVSENKKTKRQTVSKQKASSPVVRGRRVTKRGAKKKDLVKEEDEPVSPDTKSKRSKKKNSNSPTPDENTILLENMAVTDTWIDDQLYYRPLTRSMMYNMINGKTDPKLKRDPVENRSKKN